MRLSQSDQRQLQRWMVPELQHRQLKNPTELAQYIISLIQEEIEDISALEVYCVEEARTFLKDQSRTFISLVFKALKDGRYKTNSDTSIPNEANEYDAGGVNGDQGEESNGAAPREDEDIVDYDEDEEIPDAAADAYETEYVDENDVDAEDDEAAARHHRGRHRRDSPSDEDGRNRNIRPTDRRRDSNYRDSNYRDRDRSSSDRNTNDRRDSGDRDSRNGNRRNGRDGHPNDRYHHQNRSYWPPNQWTDGNGGGNSGNNMMQMGPPMYPQMGYNNGHMPMQMPMWQPGGAGETFLGDPQQFIHGGGPSILQQVPVSRMNRASQQQQQQGMPPPPVGPPPAIDSSDQLATQPLSAAGEGAASYEDELNMPEHLRSQQDDVVAPDAAISPNGAGAGVHQNGFHFNGYSNNSYAGGNSNLYAAYQQQAGYPPSHMMNGGYPGQQQQLQYYQQQQQQFGGMNRRQQRRPQYGPSQEELLSGIPENERCTLRCTLIPTYATEADIRTHFESFGHVVELQISPMQSGNKPTAATATAADEAGNNASADAEGDAQKRTYNECLVQYYSAANAKKRFHSPLPILNNRFIQLQYSAFNITPLTDIAVPSAEIIERDRQLVAREIKPRIRTSEPVSSSSKNSAAGQFSKRKFAAPSAPMEKPSLKYRRVEPTEVPVAAGTSGNEEQSSSSSTATAAITAAPAISKEQLEAQEKFDQLKSLRSQAEEVWRKKETILQTQVDKCRKMIDQLEASSFESAQKQALLQNLESKIVQLQQQLRTVRDERQQQQQQQQNGKSELGSPELKQIVTSPVNASQFNRGSHSGAAAVSRVGSFSSAPAAAAPSSTSSTSYHPFANGRVQPVTSSTTTAAITAPFGAAKQQQLQDIQEATTDTKQHQQQHLPNVNANNPFAAFVATSSAASPASGSTPAMNSNPFAVPQKSESNAP